MPDFVAGERYPLTANVAATAMCYCWLIVRGEPDLSRGRRFIKAPGDWEFWTTDGRKVRLSISGDGIIVSQDRNPDPELPPPLGA